MPNQRLYITFERQLHVSWILYKVAIISRGINLERERGVLSINNNSTVHKKKDERIKI